MTTPVPEGSRNRHEADAVAYNAVARNVMEQNHIPIDDLHSFIESKPNRENLALPANVHFRAEGSVALGEEVARHIFTALGK
jgi:lysophospholipase L1-like esterase